jgi:hypothetical protein
MPAAAMTAMTNVRMSFSNLPEVADQYSARSRGQVR